MTLSLTEYFSKIPKGPLNGTLVVSYGSQICGSWASGQLARMGATVIKYEKPGNGDPKRNNSPSTAFNQFNVGKLSVQASKSPQDEETRLKLMNMAHVIIDNRSVGAKKRDTLLHTALDRPVRDYPLIYCGLSGYGPHDERRAYDRSIQAVSGMADHNEGLVSFPVIDMSTGTEAAKVILGELLGIEKLSEDMKGKIGLIKIEVSMLDVALTMMSNMIAILHDTGVSHSTIVPFGLFDTQTEKIGLAIARDVQFETLCKILELESLQAQFPTNHLRLQNKNEVERAIQEKLQNKTAQEWQAIFQQADLPAEPVEKFADTVEQRANTIFRQDSAGGHYIASPASVFSCQAEGMASTKILPAPKLNEHAGLVQEFVQTYNGQNVTPALLARDIADAANAMQPS